MVAPKEDRTVAARVECVKFDATKGAGRAGAISRVELGVIKLVEQYYERPL